MVLFKVISIPTIKIIIAPATEKEATSKPINFKRLLPMNKKENISTPENKVALTAWIDPNFLLRSTKTGMLPKTSITANNTKLTVAICFKYKIQKIHAPQLQKNNTAEQ